MAARRFFWSWPKPVTVGSESDARRAVAVILAAGGPDDWRSLDLVALAPVVAEIPLFGGSKIVWNALCGAVAREVDGLEDRKGQVLDDRRRKVLRLAGRTLGGKGFEFSRGSALAAAYLAHRKSEDLDFFSRGRDLDGAAQALAQACEEAGCSVERFEDGGASFARFWADGVKVKVGKDAPFQLAVSDRRVEGMPVRSLKDLVADKMLALFGRATTRDFVDVFLLRAMYGLDKLMALAKEKDPGFDRVWFAKALFAVERADPKDVAMLIPLDFGQLKSELLEEAKKLLRAERDFGS